MSQLMPFVRAFRALGASYQEQAAAYMSRADDTIDERVARGIRLIGEGCIAMGDAYAGAATDLEQQIAADIARTGSQS